MTKLKGFNKPLDQLDCLQQRHNRTDHSAHEAKEQHQQQQQRRRHQNESSRRDQGQEIVKNMSNKKVDQVEPVRALGNSARHHQRSLSSTQVVIERRLDTGCTATNRPRHQETTLALTNSNSTRGARRELFTQQNGTNCTSELAAATTTTNNNNNNKWWRPCWNGRQLNGELLFEQVKARHERRLMEANGVQVSVEGLKEVQQKSISERTRATSSAVYAVPRTSLLTKGACNFERKTPAEATAGPVSVFLAMPTNCSSGTESTSSPEIVSRVPNNQRHWRKLDPLQQNTTRTSTTPDNQDDDDEEEEEDPLSDPLYASVLGTSKQLQAMAEQRKRQITRPKMCATSAAAGPQDHEMSSLVESCLEVERATRNGNLLLLLPSEREEEQKKLPTGLVNGVRVAESSERQHQLTLLSLGTGSGASANSNSSSKSNSETTTTTTNCAAGSHGHNNDDDDDRTESAAPLGFNESGGNESGHDNDQNDELENEIAHVSALKLVANTHNAHSDGRRDTSSPSQPLHSNANFDLSQPTEARGQSGETTPDTPRQLPEATKLCHDPASQQVVAVVGQLETKSFGQSANELSCQFELGDNSNSNLDLSLQQLKDDDDDGGGQMQSADATNEIVIESNDEELWRRVKESPIRVREITTSNCDQNQSGRTQVTTTFERRDDEQTNQNHHQLERAQVCADSKLATATATTTTTSNDKTTVTRMMTQTNNMAGQRLEPSAEVIKAAECNNLDNFFNHYKGEHWRKQQLERQIPSQDVRLLAAPNQLVERVGLDGEMGEKSGCNLLLENDPNAASNQSATRQTLSDEIKFIQSQKRLASQFSASLFYLNPSDKTAAPSGQSKTTLATSKQTKLPIACFKCKRPIESGTTCVRVDNLMRARSVQQAKCSSQTNNSNKKAIFQEAGAATCSKSRRGFRTQEEEEQAIEAEEQRAEKCAIKMETNNNNNNNNNDNGDKQISEEKNSSDEGLGSGSSSSTSSAANSHCDDRETPPHLHDHHHHQDHQQAVAQAPATCLIDSPLGTTRAELSIDSLAEHPNRRAKSTSGRLFSRKSRTLTWSASLGSLSASFKFGSKSAANSKSRSETNLNATVETNGDGDESIERSSRPLEPTSDSIYFHNDCFNCATCNELLVDLRALIYLSDSDESQLQQLDFNQSNSSRQSEYVNLEPAEVGQRRRQMAGDCSQQALSKTQISLYCHRHFVELFKPRCQQCDCLILDEECTEAEGKVWHIKHFCCAECSVPLGGHQYIIVDQALNQTRLRQQQQQQLNKTNEPTPKNLTNQPFCLGCFDKIFGETCVQCNRLITCDSGAINHDLRSWHASADCFKCQHCSKSLLGCPFLPSQDGRIYCSIECCEISSNSSQQPNLRQQQQQPRPNMSLAHYLDPRAIIMTNATAGTGQQQANTNSSQPVASSAHVGPDSLVRHRPLIDYLILSAHSDETSRHMLQYIRTRFERSLRSGAHTNEAQNHTNRAQELKLLDEIDQALGKLTVSTSTNTKRELQLRRDKLNPFLVDTLQQAAAAASDPNESQRRARAVQENEFVCMMMDQVLSGPTANIANNLGYMNLDSISVDISKPNGGSNCEQQQQSNSNKLVGIDCVDRAPPAVTVGNGASVRLVGQQRGQRSKLSQCSPVASLISNEGTISDHSATSSGVSTAPPGQSSANGSLKSHSPLSSTSSHSSVVSSASSAHSSVSSSAIATSTSTAPTTTAAANNQRLSQRSSLGGQLAPSMLQTSRDEAAAAAAANSAANQRQLPANGICSIAASLERRRRVQPITELSVVDLLTVADDQISTSIRHHQLLGHNHSGRPPSSPPCDGFDRLVNQFTELNSIQQRAQRTIGLKGSMGSVKPKATSAITSGRQQSDSFFFELAQRLPRTRVQPNQNQNDQQSGAGGGSGAMLQVASNGPVDTNGLPTIVDMSHGGLGGGGAQSSGGDSMPAIGAEGEARQITDHYSTVNKARNRQQMANDKDSEHNQRRRTTRDDFFAITSPLLNCQIDTLTTANTSVPLNKAGQDVTQQQQQQQQQQQLQLQLQHPGQMFRPVSSLSIFANNDANESTDPTTAPTRHGFYSTNSLNRQQTNQLLQLLPNAATASAATPTTMGCDGSPNNKQQKPLTRPAKSVSFDPNVKDPPSSSTLGRASALKSALKQQSQMTTNWHLQQDQLACHELAASMSQQQNQLLPIASSATMPASFAAQLKATTGSMVAYNAHYDEFGRRIKLSTLMQHLQQQQQQQQQQLQQQQQVPDPMTVGLLLAAEEQERQQQLEFNKSLTSDSSPLPGGSLLAKLTGGASSSRGGRREERKMLQGEQQQAIQIQPGSILQVAPVSISGDFAPTQMQPSTSGAGQLQVRGELHDDDEGAHSTTSHRRSRARVSQVSSSCSHSRRSGGRSSYSRRRSSRASPRGRHRRERSCRAPPKRATRCTTRHCRYCEYDSEETDYSSSCSTCSSSSSTDDESYTDYESDHRKHRNNSSSTSSAETRPKHLYRRNCDQANSYSGYTSASSSEEDAYDDEDDERRSCTSNSSSARSVSPAYRSSKARRVHRRRRNSRSSSNHSSARSRTSSSSTRSRTSSSSTRSRQKKAN